MTGAGDRLSPNYMGNTGGFGWDDLASVALGAAGTAIAPGVGTAIGAQLGGLVGDLFGGKPSGAAGPEWPDVAPDLKAWAEPNAPQAFIEWLKANHPGSWSSLDKIKALRYVWAYGNDGGDLNNSANPTFMLSGPPSKTAEVFATMGIDLAATQQAAQAAGWNVNNIPGELVVFTVPGGPVTVGANALAGGAPLPGVPAPASTANAQPGGQPPADSDGGGMGTGALVLVGAALLLMNSGNN